MLEAAQREPRSKGTAYPVQPALECSGSFPGLPLANDGNILVAGAFTVVDPLQSEHRNEDRKQDEQKERDPKS